MRGTWHHTPTLPEEEKRNSTDKANRDAAAAPSRSGMEGTSGSRAKQRKRAERIAFLSIFLSVHMFHVLNLSRGNEILKVH